MVPHQITGNIMAPFQLLNNICKLDELKLKLGEVQLSFIGHIFCLAGTDRAP